MTTLLEEMPWAAVVRKDLMRKVCSNCFVAYTPPKDEATKPPLRCAACKCVVYCDEKCQREDWPDHWKECEYLQKLKKPSAISSHVRLSLRVLNKYAPKLALTSQNGTCWKDIPYDPRYTSEYLEEKVKKDCQWMRQLAPKELTWEQLVATAHKVRLHARQIEPISSDVYGMGIYLSLYTHRHNCHPECFIVYSGKALLLRSTTKKTYERTLTYNRWQAKRSLLPPHLSPIACFFPLRDERAEMRQLYGFECACLNCRPHKKSPALMKASVVVHCCRGSFGTYNESTKKFECIHCNKPSKITKYEAEDMAAQIQKFLEDDALMAEHEKTRPRRLACNEMVKKASRTLSPFNAAMFNLYTLKELGLYMISLPEWAKIREIRLDVLRYYWHSHNPRWVGFLTYTIFQLKEHRIFDDFMHYFKEALENSSVCYGTDNLLVQRLQELQKLIEIPPLLPPTCHCCHKKK